MVFAVISAFKSECTPPTWEPALKIKSESLMLFSMFQFQDILADFQISR